MESSDFYKQTTLAHTPTTNKTAPNTIANFPIDSILHEGKFSTIYLGSDPETKTPLAIKVLPKKWLSQPDIVARFLEEAKIIQMANHPNIARLFDQGKGDYGLYIATEFTQGISLKQFILQHSLSTARAIDILLEVSYALLHLHGHGIIHRDLKPENILILENGHIKVIDFGIAQLAPTPKTTTLPQPQIVGTPSYMSPEQKQNPANVHFTTDIYSLGVIAYELFVGKLSFGHIQLDLLPPRLRTIVAALLHSDPKQRTQDIAEVIAALSEYKTQSLLQESAQSDTVVTQLWERLQEQYKTLLPTALPQWPEVELGLFIPRTSYPQGNYHNFIRLADQSLLIILVSALKPFIDAFAALGQFAGFLEATLHPYIQDPQKHLATADLANHLNTLYGKDKEVKLSLALLHLSPQLNECAYISCGFDALWHRVSATRKIRPLQSDYPPLGNHYTDGYKATKDRWDTEDTLLFNGFIDPSLPPDLNEQLTQHTHEILNQDAYISAPTLSQKLYTEMQTRAPTLVDQSPRYALTLTRIS